MIRKKIQFYGRVQGVGFRFHAQYAAETLGLTGWVKNLQDGSVVLEAQGGTAQLRKFYIRLKCQNHFHIEKSLIKVIEPQPYERDFRVQHN